MFSYQGEEVGRCIPNTDMQASVAHPPPELLLTCDGAVSMRATPVMSS
jgi:hypothetical protein